MNVIPIESPVSRRADPRLQYRFKRHDELADTAPIGGVKDLLGIEDILDTAPIFLYPNGSREHGATRACRLILEWLLTFPGSGWQERWGFAPVPTQDHPTGSTPSTTTPTHEQW